MSYPNPNNRNSLYPQVIQTNPDAPPPRISHSDLKPPSSSSSSSSSSSNIYPTIDMKGLVENLFPDRDDCHNPDPIPPSAPPVATEEVLFKISGAILNLIDRNYSVELACGDFSIVLLRQGANVIAVLARVADEIQWPLTKDEVTVKLDESHYFFSLRAPKREDASSDSDSSDEEGGRRNDQGSENLLNYGLTIASKGKEKSLKELDGILSQYSSFAVQKVSDKAKKGEALDVSLAKEMSPTDLKSEKKKELMEGKCAAYWTTLAPNVEDYSGTAAKLIAGGTGQVIKGILWCGDVTVERLKCGNEVMKKRMGPKSEVEIDPETLKRIKRVKRVTKMTEKVANGVLSGVIKVSGFFTGSVANSKVGKKFFGLLPGEIVLASLDGFSKVCDAVEVAGRNVMSTSSTVTTELVSHRYGEKASHATNEGLDAAGHAIGTAWAAFKIRKALDPKSVIKPSTLAKSTIKAGAAGLKAKSSK